jgi:hypothetical protein
MTPTTLHAPSHLTRATWLVLGTFFAGLTARVLLWDASGVRDLSPDHLLTIGALVGAIASGVFFGNMLRQLKLLTALGLGIAFTAATAYCLIGSAGRGDEATHARNLEVRQAKADRERAQRSLDEARTRYRAALDAETAECRSGEGGRCKAARKTTADRRSDVEVAELLLRQAKPAGRENAKLYRAAELVAFFAGIDHAVAERGLALIWPFIPPLVCELLTIVFLHLGFQAVPRQVPRVEPAEPAPDAVLAWGRGFRAQHGREPMLRELQAEFGLSKTSAWRRREALRAEGQAEPAATANVVSLDRRRRALGKMARG